MLLAARNGYVNGAMIRLTAAWSEPESSANGASRESTAFCVEKESDIGELFGRRRALGLFGRNAELAPGVKHQLILSLGLFGLGVTAEVIWKWMDNG